METMTIRGLSELPEAAGKLLRRIAAMPEGGNGKNVIAFYGEMGAGKTTLIKEICRQRGVVEEDQVNSPSFAIINEYQAVRNNEDDETVEELIYHFDFYRIKNIEEAFDFGYEEYFYSGNLCLVEWPEKIEELLPGEQTLRVRLNILDKDVREMEIEIP